MDQSITTILHLPQEVLYMIMDYLFYEERAKCRLINKHFMRVASYIFKQVRFTSRAQVKFFAESLIKNPDIGSHVQIIYVNNAALLRAINQTNIKQTCHNVKEIDILLNQGRGSWAQHLLPYSRLQHPPALMDSVNAKIIVDKYKQQIMTLRLGGKYLNSLSLQDIAHLVKKAPNVRTFGIHYLFKEKNKDIHRDLPHSLTLDDLNFLLKQPNLITRFELRYCEVANRSLIGADASNVDLIRQLRAMRSAPVFPRYTLLETHNNLTHIEMKQVQVTNVTPFVRSILDSFPNLESLDLNFVSRNMVLEFCVGSQWDLPHPDSWTADLSHKPSKLKKLALCATQSRLNVSQLLQALGKAEAPLTEISIEDSGDRENESMDYICEQFSTTLRKLTMNCKASFGLSGIGSLLRLESASLHWAHSHFEHLACPAEILQNSSNLTRLEVGYNKWYSGFISRSMDFDYLPFVNITHITLDRVVINENEMKEFLLPLVNLKEAIFRHCMFESSKQDDEDENNSHSGYSDDDNGSTAELDREEMFNCMPSSGDLEDRVREVFFERMEANERRETATQAAVERRKAEIERTPTAEATDDADATSANNTAATNSDDAVAGPSTATAVASTSLGGDTGSTFDVFARANALFASRYANATTTTTTTTASATTTTASATTTTASATTTTPAAANATPANANAPHGHIDRLLAHALAMIRPTNRRRAVRNPALSKKNNLHIRSLSLEHLGLHDCKLREAIGGMTNARTIRNFEIIQDRRSGCKKTYDIDRAYHEKKECNPHVILNKTTETEDTIGFHYTHEFGGTTGKNDYINTRPTFKIRLFSLEKLSIRPNCLMSIYFTDKDGGRLQSCKQVIKDQIKEAEANGGVVVSQPSLVESSYAQELRRVFETADPDIEPAVEQEVELEEEEEFGKEHVACFSKQQNREVEEVNKFLSNAFSYDTASSAIHDESASILNKEIFDSDIFKSVVACAHATSSSADAIPKPTKNKKTMTIRPF